MKYLNVYQNIFLSENNSIQSQPKILIPKYSSTFHLKSSLYSNISLQLQSTPYCLIPLQQSFNNTFHKNMFDYIKTPLSKRNIIPKKEFTELKRKRTNEQHQVKQIKKPKRKEEEYLHITSKSLIQMVSKLLKKIDNKQDKKIMKKSSDELTPAQKQEIASQLKIRLVQLSREQLFALKDKFFHGGNDMEVNFEHFDFSKLKQFGNELSLLENLNRNNANHKSLQEEELQRREEKERQKLNKELKIVPLYEDPFANQGNKYSIDSSSDDDSDNDSISDDI